MDVTDADVAEYRSAGVLCMRGIVGREWLARLRAAWERILSEPPVLFTTVGTPLPDTFLWTYDRTFREFVRTSDLARIAARLMCSTSARLFYDQVLGKEPGWPRTAWHQDMPYWPLRGSQLCTIWLALDPVEPSNGAMEYVVGSHAWGRTFRPPSTTGDAFWNDTGYEPLPDIDRRRSEWPIRSWKVEAGDCLIHHALTLHAAYPNDHPGRRRRAHITRWLGDDTAFDPRQKTLEFPVVVDLPAGGAPVHPLFPELWPRRMK